MKKLINFKYLIAGCIATICATGVKAQGFVQHEMIKVSGVTTDALVYTTAPANKTTTRTYFDGLGRTIQSIAMGASPSQKDMIQPVVYDNLGRSVRNYLPYTDNSTANQNGSYRTTALTDQNNFYQGTDPTIPVDSAYSRSIVEESPLQRILSTGMAGNGFQPLSGQHYKTMEYRANTSTDGNIMIWNADGSNSGNYYAVSSLNVGHITDEAGHESLVFSDLAGKTILKRDIGNSSNADTYYVYNNSGMVIYTIPPKATNLIVSNGYALTNATIANLIFSFTYDSMDRVATKTVPGGVTTSIIYDPLNRPVLTQDANQHAANKWAYIKYDVKGRPISSGIYVDNTYTSQASMQNYVTTTLAANYSTAWFETRSSSASATGYYTNVIFPSSNITPMAYNYYDDYDLNHDGTIDYSYYNTGLTGEETQTTAPVTGMPTMTSKLVVGSGVSAGTWLLSVVFYDYRGHMIQTRSNNLLNYTAGTLTDYSTVIPDFIGKPLVSYVKKSTGSAVIVQTNYSYDASDRVTSIQQSYNGNTPVPVVTYNYNSLGQVVRKNLGAVNTSTPANIALSSAITSGNNTYTATNSIMLNPGFSVNGSSATFTASILPAYLQSVDYRYNIRGQLLSINNSKLSADGGVTNSDSNDLFGMTLLYDQTDGNLGNTADYTGKLSGVKWMSVDGNSNQSYERAYNYSYDALDRLTASNYSERATAATGTFGMNRGGFRELVSYDEQGNIQNLSRYSCTPGTSSVTHIDSLSYGYNTGGNNLNQLYTVTDATGNAGGFNVYTGSTGGNYAYDANGNMTTDPYKGLTLDYNVLNKTNSITIANTATSGHINYTYDAAGNVLRKQQYNSSNTLTSTTDYLDGFVYIGGTLNYFPMPEGRVYNSGGTLKNEFVITDQQGNARVMFDNSGTGGAAKVIQQNDFYAFGMVMANSPVPQITDANKKLYNGGSEWQNDFGNLPDLMQTFYRNYDATLGRWTGIDPKAESLDNMSPYQYAGNNPVMVNDPMGDLLPLPGTRDIGVSRSGPADNSEWADGDRLLAEAQAENDAACTGCDIFHKYSYWDDPANGGGGGGGNNTQPYYGSFLKDIVDASAANGYQPVHVSGADFHSAYQAYLAVNLHEVTIHGNWSDAVNAIRNEVDVYWAAHGGIVQGGGKKDANQGGNTNEAAIAKSFLSGTMQTLPYSMSDKAGTIDCSRCTMQIAAKAGYTIPRTAFDQAKWYQQHGIWSTNLSDAQPGDHIFWLRGTDLYHTGVISRITPSGMIFVVQANVNGGAIPSINEFHLQSNGTMTGFGQPFVGIGRYKP